MQLLVISPRLQLSLSDCFSLDLSASYYFRTTRYKYHADVSSRTFTVQMGVAYGM